MNRPLVIGLLIVLAIGAGARAVEIEVKPTASELDKHAFLVPLVAPSARCAAVGEGWAAVGQLAANAPQVSLFKLDAAGKPVGEPTSIKLPRPAALPERTIYPYSMVFHPKLPLLYVWVDANPLLSPPLPDETHPLIKELDHLHVIALDGPAPTLVLSLARGPGFMVGSYSSAITFDPPTGRLYVPNLRQGMKQEVTSGIGWYHLGPDGLPLATDDEPPAKEPTVDAPAQAAAARPARVAALKALLAAGKPVGAYRSTPPKNYGLDYFPTGAGIIPINRDVIVIGGMFGMVTFNSADRAARASVFLMPVATSYYVTRLAAHPTLPIIYNAIAGQTEIYRVEHVDGFPTLVPQICRVTSGAFQGLPVVLTRRKLVAVCSTGAAIFLLPIDEEGRFLEKGATLVTILGPPTDGTHAIAYSDKHDLLYVGVEKLK